MVALTSLRSKLVGILVLVAIVGAGLVVFVDSPAEAANGAQFDPGFIISDELFYDGNAMSQGEIQAFLEAQERGSCGPNSCLKNYRMDTPDRAQYFSDTSGRVECQAYTGAANESASTIIFRIQRACGISAKVILVTLQKERGLVTKTSPTPSDYTVAMGYGCPDSSACDTTYYGLFNQIRSAAEQFKRYRASPGYFNYRAGRVFNVQYKPYTDCGTLPVYIQNQATAGLYNYTPYVPNAAALANLYGTGDGCSSYGNRNFWAYYTDWFGDPALQSSLVRSPTNGTVYFLANGFKYPIGLTAIYNALAPLGPLTIATDRYLSEIPSGNLMPRLVRDPGGTLYFFDVGYKLPFSTCDLVADYGQSCTNWVQLSQAQADRLPTGPLMTKALGTTSGKRFVMAGGIKHEVSDLVTLQQGGYSTNYNVILESSIDPLPLGAPLTRDLTFVRDRQTDAVTFISGGTAYQLTAQQAVSFGVSARTDGILDSVSLAKLDLPRQTFSGIVADPGGRLYALSIDGKRGWNQAAPAGVVTPAVSQQFIDSYPTLDPIGDGAMLKTASNGTVYVLHGGVLRPITYWADVVTLSPGNNPVLITLADAVISSLPKGPLVQRIGSLVRINGNATVFLIQGLDSMIPVGTYEVTDQFGLSRSTSVLPPNALVGYAAISAVMGYGVDCSGKKYVGMGGSLHSVTGLDLLYPLGFPAVDGPLCSQVPLGHDAGRFISTPDGTIWLLEAGQRRPIASWPKFVELYQTLGTSNMAVSWDFARRIPEGSLIS